MKIENRNESNFAVLAIDGNIVLEDTAKLKETAEVFIEDETLAGVILNCERVEFVDSSGLGLIVSIYKTLLKRGRKFALTNLNERTREIFILTKLDKILTITSSDEDAIKVLTA
ncbi:MAG: STAS domain-containing protein [SAR324 cluster bacterium]|nr:STAS domain-containing protein [SAR324 cluster bacterium]